MEHLTQFPTIKSPVLTAWKFTHHALKQILINEKETTTHSSRVSKLYTKSGGKIEPLD